MEKENSNRKKRRIAFQIYLVNDVRIAHILTTHTFCPKTNGYRISEETIAEIVKSSQRTGHCFLKNLSFRSCYCTAPSEIWEIFSEFLMFCSLFQGVVTQKIIVKHVKRGKYLPISPKAPCDNCFIVNDY